MIQYMRLKHTKHTGNTMREYLSISDGVMPGNVILALRLYVLEILDYELYESFYL